MAKEGASTDQMVADLAWTAMRRHKVTPLPRHFELWFSYVRGSPAGLKQAMDAMVAERQAFTPAVLDALHGEHLAPSPAPADSPAEAQAVRDIAATLLAQVASNQQGVAAYGKTLARWTAQLQRSPTIGGLQQAIADLVAETQQAHARNAMLEQQIASSIVRVDEMQQRMMEAEHTASTDPLTGLSNRAVFDRTLHEAVAQARGGGGCIALLLLDIDHFKQFNDRFGHPVGDLVLRLVARVLAGNVKGRDTVARYGGEEFAIVLTDAGLHAAAIVGEQIRQALSKLRLTHKNAEQPMGSITVSIGVAVFRGGDTGTDLVERADRALYRAKHSGRNLVCTEAMVPPEVELEAG